MREDLVGLFHFLITRCFKELQAAHFSVSPFKVNVLIIESSHTTSTANQKEGNIDLKLVQVEYNPSVLMHSTDQVGTCNSFSQILKFFCTKKKKKKKKKIKNTFFLEYQPTYALLKRLTHTSLSLLKKDRNFCEENHNI